MDEGLISIYLPHALCYIAATSSVETTSRRFVFAGNSFSDRSVTNTMFVAVGELYFNYWSPRDTDIRQCIYTITHILFIVLIATWDSFDNALLFASERMQDGVGLGQV